MASPLFIHRRGRRDYKKSKGRGKMNFTIPEPLVKLLKARESCHSGQAKRDPESSFFEQFWIPAFAEMTE